ncbi:hypothetical protein [Streptomyces sp. NPDC056337]|uniref:hypothetical protein n=1 Tax=Streptomyces sp. NPDC056337 TaxID=3345787 RepID=UPI0035E26737
MTADVRVPSTLSADVFAVVRRPRTACSAWREGARRVLRVPGVRGGLEEAVHRPELRPGVLAVAQVDVADVRDAGFTVRVEQWLRMAGATWQESAAFCADVAWQARRDGRRLAEEVGQAEEGGGDVFTSRTRLHLRGLALRYDFRRLALEEVMRASGGPWDPFGRALFAFALLGQSKPEGLEEMDAVLAEAGTT